MKLKINDKRKLLQFIAGAILVCLILILALPHVLNVVFGNSINDEVVTITTDVVSEIDVDFVGGEYALYNSQGLKTYNRKGEFQTEYYKSAYVPFMHNSGNYSVLSDTSSTDFTVLRGKTNKYEGKAPQNIKSVTVNKKGYSTVITGETGYKSLVIVFDNKGNEKYRWYSDETYAVDAKLSDNSKILAVASVKMEANKLVTVIEQYKLGEENVISRVHLDDIIPYNIAFDGTKLVLIGNEKAYSISRTGKIKNEYDYKGRVLECFDIGNIDDIVLALSEDNGATEVVILNNNLKVNASNRCEFLVTMLDENNGKIIAAGESKAKIITHKGNVLTEGKLSKDGNFIVLADNWRNFAVFSSGYINIYNVKRGR